MLKKTMKQITPAPAWRWISDRYWWWRNRGSHVLAQRFDPRWHESQLALAGYRNLFYGKRCFIIGNGPSLQKTDLSLLRSEVTFGLNRIYLLFNEIEFKTTFLVGVNDLVLEQCTQDLQSLELVQFLTWRARRFFNKNPRIIYIDSDFTGDENFTPDATQRLFEGFTVTYVAMQIAFFMGFKEVILIGVDHNFITKGEPNAVVTSHGEDPNHFTGAYFGKGFRWQLPDLEGSERAYRMAKSTYEADQRKIIDATIGGKLTIFPKVAYESLFDRSV
jgi:hypothetical protein